MSQRKAAAKSHYHANPEHKRAASIRCYRAEPEVKKAVFKQYYSMHRSARLRYFRKYHCYTKRIKVTKVRYSLAQPTQLVIEKFFRCAQASLLADSKMKTKLIKQFESQHIGVARKLSRKYLGSIYSG